MWKFNFQINCNNIKVSYFVLSITLRYDCSSVFFETFDFLNTRRLIGYCNVIDYVKIVDIN